ncbi:hypothetical protein EV182_006404 [Spiromyces aspiralis]|uniref:Uncharacterized protein n=1 Tax=Spiromyces aspiralis TaxID=68401 RepID=A0ACC1H8Y7_9FUNG|nr:hypothetical protein EV182_006404 [Spiromyces aspiralis]
MFNIISGPFRPTLVALGGKACTRKANVRKRLRAVDSVIDTLVESGVQFKQLELAKQLPKEHEMQPRDKYTTFSRTARNHRKGVHKVPKFTRKALPRITPVGF